MAYSVASERQPLAVEELTVEVQPIGAWPIYRTAVGLAAAFYKAAPTGQIVALRELYGFFVAEAQPTWEIVDHRGPIPPTPEGMLRLPLPLASGMIDGWISAYTPKPSAVDAMVPEGPLRDELNRALRRKRKTSG